MSMSSTSVTTSTGADAAVRPFRAEFAEEAIVDLQAVIDQAGRIVVPKPIRDALGTRHL
jgi:DNA-binding transcriptional regulator/RsmH inhibitor MraZ